MWQRLSGLFRKQGVTLNLVSTSRKIGTDPAEQTFNLEAPKARHGPNSNFFLIIEICTHCPFSDVSFTQQVKVPSYR